MEVKGAVVDIRAFLASSKGCTLDSCGSHGGLLAAYAVFLVARDTDGLRCRSGVEAGAISPPFAAVRVAGLVAAPYENNDVLLANRAGLGLRNGNLRLGIGSYAMLPKPLARAVAVVAAAVDGGHRLEQD